MSHLYPVFLNIEGQNCLVIGGGAVAERKVSALLECGARVRVVAPRIEPGLRRLAELGRISLDETSYSPVFLDDLSPGRSLVFIATDDRQVNRQAYEDSVARGLTVNTVDDPELCTFYVPASVRRGSLSIAVSTEGKSPLLARRIRENLESQFGPEYSEYIDLLGECREKVLKSRLDDKSRRSLFAELIDSNLLELIRTGRKDLAKERAYQCLSSWLV